MRYLALIALAGCLAPPPCIQPPPTSSQQTRDIVVGLTAKFAAISPVSPTLQTDFKQTVNTVYQQLDNVDAGYYIAFQAAICFSKDGKWGQDVAIQILKYLADDYHSRSGKTVDQHPQALEIKAGTEAIKK